MEKFGTLSPETRNNVVVLSGETHQELAQDVAEAMGVELGKISLRWHPNGEPYVGLEESVRGQTVFAIQSHARTPGMSPSDSLQQYLGIIDVAYHSDAEKIIAVCPNFAGSRSDKQDEDKREAVFAGVNLRNIRAAGASHIFTVDLHNPAVLIAFDGPSDNLNTRWLLESAMAEKIVGNKEEYVVVSADVGHSKQAAQHASTLGLDLVNLKKTRDTRDTRVVTHQERTVDDVDGKVCVIFEDMIDTAGTLLSAAGVLKASGSKKIYVAATHGWFSDPGIENLSGNDCPIDHIIVTDTMPSVKDAKDMLKERLQVVPIGGFLAEALAKKVLGKSIKAMYKQ